MDIFLVEGIDVIFRLGLALLEHSHDKLLELDLEDMTKVCVWFIDIEEHWCTILLAALSKGDEAA